MSLSAEDARVTGREWPYGGGVRAAEGVAASQIEIEWMNNIYWF